MAKLGIRTITANPQSDAETFASLDKLVAEYDMRIAIHNHGPGAIYDKLDGVVKAIKDHDQRIGQRQSDAISDGYFRRHRGLVQRNYGNLQTRSARSV